MRCALHLLCSAPDKCVHSRCHSLERLWIVFCQYTFRVGLTKGDGQQQVGKATKEEEGVEVVAFNEGGGGGIASCLKSQPNQNPCYVHYSGVMKGVGPAVVPEGVLDCCREALHSAESIVKHKSPHSSRARECVLQIDCGHSMHSARGKETLGFWSE